MLIVTQFPFKTETLRHIIECVSMTGTALDQHGNKLGHSSVQNEWQIDSASGVLLNLPLRNVNIAIESLLQPSVILAGSQ